jgi:MraZ protein
VVLTTGVEKCITAYPMAEWQKLADSLPTGSLSRSKIRILKRAMFGSAFVQPLDNQGRISLPAPLREHAGIQEDVAVIGANNYLELWGAEEWAAEKISCQEQAGQIIESLEG